MALYENETLEYKRQYTPDIKKEVVAFANTAGGTIYIGVDDNGTPVGVQDPDAVVQQLTNALRDGIRPDVTMFTRIAIQDVGGCPVVAVTVSTGTRRPYYLTDKGLRPSGVYLRQGASSAPASEDAIRRMIRLTDGDSFENGRSLTQELTFHTFESEMQQRHLSCGPAQYQTLGILAADGLYTNLGLLVSDQCQHSIKLAVFQGTDKLLFKDRKEFGGSIFQQLNEAYQAIDFYNGTRASFEGLLRKDERDYPMEAVREALLNAVVHRDYSFSGSISINLYQDRLELISLGGLVSGFSLEAALMGASQPRNGKLAALFYRMDLIEAYGTGLGKILNCYAGLPIQPSFESVEGAFRVVLPNIHAALTQKPAHAAEGGHEVIPPEATALTASEQKALQAIQQAGQVSRRELESLLGVGTTRAVVLLKRLVELGKVQKTGNGKNTRYQCK